MSPNQIPGIGSKTVGTFTYIGCPAHYFVCNDKSKCIDPKRYLDGIKDCNDSSDEPCPATQFACRDGSKCVAQKVFQDGVKYAIIIMFFMNICNLLFSNNVLYEYKLCMNPKYIQDYSCSYS